jgi:uncharacterized protein (TIGR02266 family)
MAPGPADKRESPRIPFILRVDYPDAKHALDATENLSSGGLFIQTDRKLQVGDSVPLSLSFPDLMEPMQLTGTVTWIRAPTQDAPGGVGVKIEKESEKKALQQLMAMVISTETKGATDSPPEKKDGAGYSVLIVEDNPHITEMYGYVLKKLAAGELGGKVPLDVQFAGDGHAAMQLLAGREFSLIITDLYMPVMDGFALVEKIRSDGRLQGVPIIAISAGGPDARQRALELGVDIYLKKPVKFLEVLETVKQLLRIH